MRTRIAVIALLVAAWCALCAACSAQDSSSDTDDETKATRGSAIAIHYVDNREDDESESGGGRVEVDVIARGDQSRTTTAFYFTEDEADETFLTILDGNRALLHNENAEPAYQVLEAADEHPDDIPFESGPLNGADRAFRAACPNAEPIGTRTILGRETEGHACAWYDAYPVRQHPDEIWVDNATGRLLEYGHLKATEVDLNPTIDKTTFSTTPPPGANVRVVKATGKIPPAPAAPKPPEDTPEEALLEIAAASTTPIYYLGEEFDGEDLIDVTIDGRSVVGDSGDLTVDNDQVLTLYYGESLQLETTPFGPSDYGPDSRGCERLEPQRGVPAVAQSDAVSLFTADLVVRLGGLAYTPKRIEAATAALLAAGDEASLSGDLPAPKASNVSLLDKACGAKPGTHGLTMDE